MGAYREARAVSLLQEVYGAILAIDEPTELERLKTTLKDQVRAFLMTEADSNEEREDQ